MSDYLFCEDWLYREFVYHFSEVIGDKGKAASQKFSCGFDNLGNSIHLLYSYFFLSFFVNIGNHDHFSLADSIPEFLELWFEHFVVSFADAVQPSSVPNDIYRHLRHLNLFFFLDLESIECGIVEILNNKFFRVDVIDVWNGFIKGKFFDNIFLPDVDDVDGGKDFWCDEDHTTAHILHVSGKKDLSKHEFLYFSIETVDFFQNSIIPHPQKAIFWQKLNNGILILNGYVLDQPILFTKFPSNCILIGDHQQKKSIVFYFLLE